MFETTLNNHNYRINGLNTFDQAKVLKRISPMVPVIASVLIDLAHRAKTDEDQEISFNDIAVMAKPVIDVFSAMPDDDMEFVLKICLSAVMIQVGKEWHPVMSSGQLMYDHIDMADMMVMAYLVIRDDISNFTAKIVTNLIGVG